MPHTCCLRVICSLFPAALCIPQLAHAYDSTLLEQCVQPYYQNRLSSEAALRHCLDALRATSAPAKYWQEDKTYAKWRVKAGRVVWLALDNLLSRGGQKPDEQNFSWLTDEMRAIAESRAISQKYTSRAYIVFGSIKGLIAKYYRSGMSRKNIGKESFHAIRQATLVDPYNPEYWNREAWFTYGKALVEICTGGMPRMAAYVLDIDLKTEVARTTEALARIPPPNQTRRAEHAQLELRLRDLVRTL